MLKKWSMVTAVFVMTLMVLFITVCGDDADESHPTGKTKDSLPVDIGDETQPIGGPRDYFPIDIGREWTYEIKIGEVEPIFYNETMWSQGSMTVVYSTIGRFLPLLEDMVPEIFLLRIKVKGPAEKQGLLEYPVGVKLTIEIDELGIFEDHEEVFWAITGSGRLSTQQVVTYSPSIPGAPTGQWGTWGAESGHSMRLLLFGAEPGTGIGLADSPDVLYFEGITECEAIPCLHFQRVVTLSDDEEGENESSIGKDFTEDTWFAKGVGLIRLEQRVEGIISMTWTLK